MSQIPPQQPYPTQPTYPAQAPYAGQPPLGYAAPPMGGGVDLNTIATRQRTIMYCILGYVLLFVAQFAVPGPVRMLFGLAAFAVSVTAAVFVFMLALSLYNTGVGILLGILTLVPLIGLLVLLTINGKATNILRHHGIRVGLMGADSSQVPPPGQVYVPVK